MPIICYKFNIKINDYEELISFAFNCCYNDNYHLKLQNNTHFDCEDFRIKIKDAIKELNYNILKEYENKNNGVRYLAILNYFYNKIPELYSLKFICDSGDSIYYVSELK